ncbi:hypothetical protein JCM10213_001437 [Rhodosporidiobolus nylandii]
MLDRLPPELLDHLLQLAAPPSSTLDEDIERSRRTTLRACALVCRHVSGVAQRLLWKDLALVAERDVAKVQQALQDEDDRQRAKSTRTVFVDRKADFGGLEALLPHLVGLLELSINRWYDEEQLSVAALASLANLRALETHGLTLKGDWAGARFPSLVRLRLDGVYLHADAFPLVFRQDAFPALRALELSCLYIQDDEEPAAGFPTLPLPFLAQLDMVSLYVGDLDVLPPSIFSSSTPVVLEVTSFRLQSPQLAASVAAVQPRHIALRSVNSKYPETSATLQQSLSALVRLCSLPSRLSSLHLPSSLRDILPDATTFHQLEQACKQHGVELLWYAGDSDDLFFHFWGYAKTLKAARQADDEA